MAFINRGPVEAKTVEFPGTRPALTAVPPLPSAAHTSIIGSDLTIVGQQITIITKGCLRVDGEVCADLHGAEIIIGESGKVTGTVVGEKVSVRGEVNGAVRGVRVELQSKARVQGEVHHQTLAIAEGAHFDGRVRRPQDREELLPVLDPAAHANKGSGASV
jgi:cytoskeletal protein CcmA (bactofilin family)